MASADRLSPRTQVMRRTCASWGNCAVKSGLGRQIAFPNPFFIVPAATFAQTPARSNVFLSAAINPCKQGKCICMDDNVAGSGSHGKDAISAVVLGLVKRDIRTFEHSGNGVWPGDHVGDTDTCRY